MGGVNQICDLNDIPETFSIPEEDLQDFFKFMSTQICRIA